MALNVIIVDDSGVMRSMVRRTLEMSGIELGQVYQAANGQEALALLESNWIDLALVDINMPVMNGEELIAAIRSRPEMANLPVIVISTEGSETRIERLHQQGAAFVHKPFTPEMIGEIVGHVLEASQ